VSGTSPPTHEEPPDLGEAIESDLLSTPAAGPAAVRGGAIRIGSFLGGALLSVGAAALLFRHLGVVNTGRYTTAISLAAIVTGFTDLGLTAIGVRELSVLRGEQRAGIARSLLGIRLVLTTVGVAIITVFAFLAYGTLLGFGVLIAGVGVLIQNVQSTLAVPLMATLRLTWVAVLDLSRQLVVVVLIVALVAAGAGLLPFLATGVVAAVVVLIPTAMLARKSIPLLPSLDLARWRTIVGPVLTYSIAAAASTLYFRAAIVIVSLLASGVQLGYFSISFRIVEVLFTVPALLVSSAFPIFARAARDDPARLGYAISRVFEVALIVGVWISLSLAVGARFAIAVVGGVRFLPATSVLAIQGIAVGATFVGTVWGYGMLSLHLHKQILGYNLAMLGLVVVAVSVLTPLDGAQGAAIGTAAVELAGAVGFGLLLFHGRPHLVPRGRALPRVAVAAALGATPALLSPVPVFVRLILSTLIYGVAILALGALPDEVYDVLPSWLRRG
jgi:O-antigen/teichoic acid export membrane protein